MDQAAVELTLFYDGDCSMCVAAMGRLARRDHSSRLAFVNTHAPKFCAGDLGVTLAALDSEIHGLTAGDEASLVGIDSIAAAYAVVGLAWLAEPLKVEWAKPLLAAIYRFLARNRYRVSRLFGASCQSKTCRF